MGDLEVVSLEESEELLPQCISLIEESFSYDKKNSFAVDFYPLIKKENYKNLYVLLSQGEVISHVGILPRNITCAGQAFPVALVGGICTKKNAQGMGNFDTLFSHILEKENKYLCYLLWSNLDRFYRKYDFHQVGMVDEMGDGEFFAPDGYTKANYNELSRQDQTAVREIYNKYSKDFITIKRGDKEWAELAEIKSADFYIKRDRLQNIISYFVVNKGMDLTGIIHEALGEKVWDDFESQTHWIPGGVTYTKPVKTMYGCLLRIDDKTLFSSFVYALSQGKIVVEAISEGSVRFNFAGQGNVLTTEDFLHGLFGPGMIEEFKEFYRPLWIGGLDSV